MPVIFAGLSLALEEVRGFLLADARPPVRAGDLDGLEPRSTVAIIDGELDPGTLLSLEEICRALARGIAVHGAASVGAMRAAELAREGMRGIGWVYDAFLSGRISGPDEIAVLYDPIALAPMTVPLVSIRYRLEHLVATGEISASAARATVMAARALSVPGRTPECIENLMFDISGSAGLASRAVPDIKAWDARRLLRRLQPHG